MRPPEREPSMPGEKYFPPDQPVSAKYWLLRIALSRKRQVEVPFSE